MAARLGTVAALLLSATIFYTGVHWGSAIAGGADSYGYVSEAGLIAQGRLEIELEIVRASPWPLAIKTWTPLGYRPSLDKPDAIVPVYPPGLPMLMALAQSVGGFCAAFLIAPAAGALTIWLTYLLGQRAFGLPSVSLAAAVLVASSPVFLYQLMNPMTDVPVTAAWALATLLAMADRPLAAGFASTAAVLIRPNLAPVALVLAGWQLVIGRQRGTRASARLLRFAASLLPAIVIVGAIHTRLYGAPWIAGYGELGDLYALRNAAPNLVQFARWLLETQTPVVALALAPLVVPRARIMPKTPGVAALLGAVIAAIVVCYVFYIPFDAWWYLRFLLPMWPMMMVLVAAAPPYLLGPGRAPAAVLTVLVAVVAVSGVRLATRRSAFELGRGERRYATVARFIRDHTEPDAIVMAVQHSGSLRLYAGRLTLRYDELDPLWLDRAVDFLQANGRHPYIVLEGWEVDRFRNRFGDASAIGRLDWKPIASYLGPSIAIYDAVGRTAAAEPLAIGAGRRAGWRCEEPYVWPPPLRMK